MDAGHRDIGRHDGGTDPDRGRGRNRAISRRIDDDTQTLELQHQVGNQCDDADHRNQDAQRGTVILAREKIRLSDQPVFLGVTPDRWQ